MSKQKTASKSDLDLTILVEPFAKAFNQAASVCPARSPKAVLEYVLLTTREEDGEEVCELTATNLEVSVTVRVSSIVNRGMFDAAVLLPAKRFHAMLGTLRDDEMHLTLADNSAVSLVSGRTRMQFPTLPVKDFPQLPTPKLEKQLTVGAEAIRVAIDRTAYATDTESSRYSLGGIFLEATGKGDVLTLVATDGHRLAIQRLDFTGDAEAIADGSIVPVTSALLMRKLFADYESPVVISGTTNSLFCSADNVRLSTRLAEGRFPNWRNCVPKHGKRATVNAGELLDAVLQVSLSYTEEHKASDWLFNGDLLSLDIETPEVGKVHAELPIAVAGGDDSFSLDCIFAKQYLAKLDRESQIEISYDGEKAVCFKSPEGMAIIQPLARD